MYCLVKQSSAFMEYEHYEALLFSPNKQALESMAVRISPFVSDKYSVIYLDNIRSSSFTVMYCHRDDSDLNYSIIHDDSFMEEIPANTKELARIIVDRRNQGVDGLGLKVAPVMHSITRKEIMGVFGEIGADFVRPVRTYTDFCTLEEGLKRLKRGIQSEQYYLDADFASSLLEYHGFIYDASMAD